MATGATANYDLPYPLSSDPVDIHGDLQDLAEQIELILPILVNHTIEVRNISGATIAKATPVPGQQAKPAQPAATRTKKLPTIGGMLPTDPRYPALAAKIAAAEKNK